jgi:hypothetical protein
MRLRLFAVVLLLAACPTAADDDDVTPVPIDDDDAGRTECDPPLTVTPEAARVLPLALLLLDGEGGSGDYVWSFAEDASGGLLNDRTGAYLAGNEALVTDVVRLTDSLCDGEATVRIEVLAPMDVLPGDLEVPPGTSIGFLVTHGSGSHECTISSDGSGALVDDACRYTAGATQGLDLVRVEDLETGQFLLRQVIVDPDATLAHDPPRLAIPLGADYRLRPSGGSGYLEVSTDVAGIVQSEGVTMTAMGPGQVQVTLTDVFTAQTTGISVDVVAPLTVDMLPWGDILHPGKARSGDLNGDGHTDLVVTYPAVTIDGYQGGAAFVYAGAAGGIDPVPVQILAGDDRDEWGYGLDLADVDGDGELDLIIGAEEDDGGGSNAGAVFVFPGVAGGWFADAPTTTLLGPRNSARFGRSVVACDFNGDGLLDLAVGAYDDENRALADTQDNQGAVYVHLGSATGFDPLPTQILWGRARAAGTWFDHAGQRLGLYLAAGDIDGDGRCELAAGTYDHDGPLFNNEGLVVVFQGTETGVSPDPWRAFGQLDGDETHSAELGRALALGDVDGDGLADLLIAATHQSVPDLNSAIEGRVHLFLATTLAGLGTGVTDILDADWTYDGDSSSDLTGLGVLLTDLNGDGLDDVVIGAVSDEVPDGTDGTGTVAAFLGVSGGIPEALPIFEWPGATGGDWFGAWMAPLDDIDGDGLADLGVFAPRSNVAGLEVGLPYVLGTADGALTGLQWPVLAGNHDFASAITFLPDLDGDGDDELLIGSDEAPRLPEVRRAGRVLLYTDLTTSPEAIFEAWPGHGDNDRLGRDVAPIGDFDGDGRVDFAVVAFDDHKPGTFAPESFANPDECPGSSNDSGSVWVFLGEEAGIASTPSFVVYGPQTNQSIQRVAGGDVDGDGFSDVIFTGPAWDAPEENNAGGFGVMYGRAHSGSGIRVVCDPWTFVGRLENDNLGDAVTGIGDIDGDGCDEFAVSAYREDLDANNQGTVRVVYGWGPSCARASVEAVTFVGGQANANLGRGLDGGVDVDDDGLPDLAVGADNHTVGGAQVGRAYLLTGAHLQTFTPEPLVEGEEPTTTHPILPPAGWYLNGRVDEEDFGRSLALIPNLSPPYGGLVAGTPGGAQSGIVNTGGARVYGLVIADGDVVGLNPEPILVISGESWNRGSRLGNHVAAGTVDGGPWIVVGSIDCDGPGVDSGCAYALPVTP